MNKLGKQIVDSYLESLVPSEKQPLRFGYGKRGYRKYYHIIKDATILSKKDGSILSTEDLICYILLTCKHFPSLDARGEILLEHRLKRRSSLDIWRHCLYYKPTITLITVMRALYDMTVKTNEELKNPNTLRMGYYAYNDSVHKVADFTYGVIISNYCTFVKKRVFRVMATTFISPNSDSYIKDEYGLLFDEWK